VRALGVVFFYRARSSCGRGATLSSSCHVGFGDKLSVR
jgi:hypothetical protein